MMARRIAPVAAVAIALVASACSAPPDAAPEATPERAERIGTRIAEVSEPHAATGMTLLEGPSFAEDGRVRVVDVTAPPCAPKVMLVEPDSGEVETLYDGDALALTSARPSPADGLVYATDFATGSIWRMQPDGSEAEVFFEGEVDGVRMNPDDIAFDADGHLFVTDAAGAQAPHWAASGRLVRIDGRAATATVLATELPSPNGIAFTPDGSGLWVSMNTGNRIDYLRLSEDGLAVARAHPAISVDGGIAQVDSLAVDVDGNLYAGLHDRPAILVHDRFGTLIETVEMEGMTSGSATNLAIEPGGTRAVATVSDAEGGYLYEFEALGEGLAG